MTTISDALILYHADCDDGFGAAYAAWLSLGDGAEYQPVYYGDQIPPERLTGRQVFILDFSFSPDLLRNMAQHAAKIVLLDHHKSAASQWIGVEPIPNVEILFDMDRSGAQMAWDYLQSGSVRPPLIDHNKLASTVQYSPLRWTMHWRFPSKSKCSCYLTGRFQPPPRSDVVGQVTIPRQSRGLSGLWPPQRGLIAIQSLRRPDRTALRT